MKNDKISKEYKERRNYKYLAFLNGKQSFDYFVHDAFNAGYDCQAKEVERLQAKIDKLEKLLKQKQKQIYSLQEDVRRMSGEVVAEIKEEL